MIRILHTADWHLGQTFFGYDRTEEQEHFLSWVSVQLKENEIDVLIIAGDVFDVSNPSAASQRMFYRFLQQVTEENPSLQVIVVAGNHDSAARLEAPLPLLQKMRTEIKGVVPKVDGEIDYDRLLIELKNRKGEAEAICMAVPFLRQGDYPAVETDGNPYAEGVKELYLRLSERALTRKKGDMAVVAIGHLQVTGSEIADKDYSERTIIGGLECVSPVAFSEEIAYTALGHIHKSQRVSGRENIRYAGSPLAMSFAEKNYHHGAVMVTVDGGKPADIRKLDYNPLCKLISLPRTGAAALPGDILEELKNMQWPEESSLPYLEIKVLLTEPEPMLRQQIEEALADKPVRLARIVSVYRQAEENATEEKVLAGGLQEMTPVQIVKAIYENTYQAALPDELMSLFREACLALTLEEPKQV